MKGILAIALLSALCGCLRPPVDTVAGPALYVVSLPTIVLKGGEMISSVRVDLVGARARAVNTVPDDWSVEIGPAVSGGSEVTLRANHTMAWLRNAYGLARFLTIAADDNRLHGITATVRVSSANGEREIAVSPGDMVLEPLPLAAP